MKAFIDLTRIQYRPLTAEEEALESQSQEIWKLFLAKVQEAINYVNTQSPTIVEQLNGLYKKYIEELRKIHLQGTTGKFLDPYENAVRIIDDYKKLTGDFASVEKILRQCASWRETITMQREELGFVERLSKQLRTRKELWKFYQVCKLN